MRLIRKRYDLAILVDRMGEPAEPLNLTKSICCLANNGGGSLYLSAKFGDRELSETGHILVWPNGSVEFYYTDFGGPCSALEWRGPGILSIESGLYYARRDGKDAGFYSCIKRYLNGLCKNLLAS